MSSIDLDEHPPPPPPYTPQSLSSGTSFSTTITLAFRPSLRGGYIRPGSSFNQIELASAAAYFEERAYTLQHPSYILEHRVVVPPDVSRESLHYPQPEEQYQERDVSVADWQTFVNFLLPARAESSAEKDNAGEDPDERFERIDAVAAEWNEGFFGPRGIRILWDIQSIEAPEYSSVIDTIGDSISVDQAEQSTPLAVVESESSKPDCKEAHRASHRICGPHSYQRRPSDCSTTSTSSSSSFSSSSIESFSSGDLVGSNFPQILETITSLRHDLAGNSNLKASIRKVRKDLRAQRRSLPRNERKQWSREFKTELRAQKKAIKTEVKSLIKEAKAIHKIERKAWKVERKAERESRRAERREKRYGRKNQPPGDSAVGAKTGMAARAFEAKARELESQLHARGMAHEAHPWSNEREMREKDLALERDARAREVDAQAREMALEAGARAREVDAQAREMALEAYARAREVDAQAREMALEADARVRERDVRARQKSLQADTRARERDARERQRSLKADARARERHARERNGAWCRKWAVQEDDVVDKKVEQFS